MAGNAVVGNAHGHPHCSALLGAFAYHLQNPDCVGVGNGETFAFGGIAVSLDEVMSRLATLPKQTEWEALTAQYQQAEATATSDAKWKMMERIFHLYEHEADYSEYISEDICH